MEGELLSVQTFVTDPACVVEHCLDALAKDAADIDAVAQKLPQQVLQRFRRRFATRSSLLAIPQLCFVPKEGHSGLFRATVMVQHDSLGEQFFVPLARTADGRICNVGTFCSRPTAHEANSAAKVMGRTMVVSVAPPGSQEWADASHPPGPLLLLLYDDDGERGSSAIRVNQILDIVGLFGETAASDEEYPYSLPTVHVVLQSPHTPDLLPLPAEDLAATRAQFMESMQQMQIGREASESTLASLLSSITLRQNGLATSLLIGSYPLNLRLAPGDLSDTLVSFIKTIMPRVVVVSLEASALEQGEFASRMDYESGKLVQGVLQVADGTVVVVDERHLQPGKLSETAARNIQALVELLVHQIVHYDFAGHRVPIPTNVPLLSISHGKSILPVPNFNCSHARQFESSVAVPQRLCTPQSLDSETAHRLRCYLAHCRSVSAEIPAAVADEIEQDYARANSDASCRGAKKQQDANCLSSALNLARLLAASHGHAQLAFAHYQEALRLIVHSMQ